MKTTIAAFLMLMLATPAFTMPYCRHPKQPTGTGTSLINTLIPENCRLTQEQRREKAICMSQTEGERGRVCWGYGLY